jgi:hypothetical protein
MLTKQTKIINISVQHAVNKKSPRLKGLYIQIDFINGYDMAWVIRSLIDFQNLKSGGIHSTTIALKDSKTLSDFQINLRSKLQIHRPVARPYLIVIKHI